MGESELRDEEYPPPSTGKSMTPLGTMVGIVLLLCIAAVAVMATIKVGLVMFG